MHCQIAWGESFFADHLGIARNDAAAQHQWFLHNIDLFRTPIVAVIMRDEGFHHVDSLSGCLFVRGIESCLMASVAGYAGILGEELIIERNTKVLCAMAIGYPGADHKANQLKTPKEVLGSFARFVEN
jgi:hypothetical protein